MTNIVQKVYEYLGTQRKTYAPRCNYASQCGHPCERCLVYARTHWQEKLLPTADKLLIFQDGNLHEQAVLRLLNDAGYEVIEQQRPFEWRDLELSGRIDGKIKADGKVIPLEIKSMNPYEFPRINKAEDLLNSSKPWTRGYITQMFLYLLMMNEEEGIILFKNKATGALKQIEVKLDYEYAEGICKKLERVNSHVKAGTLPERTEERAICQYCDFRHICLPDETSDSIVVVDSPEILEKLEERDRLAEAAKEYEALDKEIKELLKGKDLGTYLVAGKYQVKISTYSTTKYEVPDDIKKQYAGKSEIRKVLITSL